MTEEQKLEAIRAKLDKVGNWRMRQKVSSSAQSLMEATEFISNLMDDREFHRAADHILMAHEVATEFLQIVDEAFPEVRK